MKRYILFAGDGKHHNNGAYSRCGSFDTIELATTYYKDLIVNHSYTWGHALDTTDNTVHVLLIR